MPPRRRPAQTSHRTMFRVGVSHADSEPLSASKLILDTKNPAYRAVAAVWSEASSCWRTVTLPFPEAGIRPLPQSLLGTFASTMQTYRERLQEAARELAAQYDQIKNEAQRRLGTLFNASDYPSTLDGLFDLEVSYPTIEPQTLRDSNRLRQMMANDFTRIEQAVGDLLVDRPRRNILRRGGVGGAA